MKSKLKSNLCEYLVNGGYVKAYDTILHSYTNNRMSIRNNTNCVQSENNIAPTLTTRADCIGVVIPMKEKRDTNLITDDGNIRRYVGSDIVDQFKVGQAAYINYPNGYGHGKRTSDIAFAMTCNGGGTQLTKESDLRIRKLTPNECLKLMGVKKSDREKISKNQSDASLYHLAGDSIVTTCLMGIFGELFGIDYQKKIDEVVQDVQEK